MGDKQLDQHRRTTWPEAARPGAARSFLGADLVVEGQLASSGPVDVYGKVTGEVRAPELVIAPAGVLDGAAIAHTCTVQGQVTGSIKAISVTLRSSADVGADIAHDRIAIEAGAVVEGRMTRPG